MRRVARACALTAVLTAAAGFGAEAQAQTGQISRVAELLGASKYRMIASPDTSARIRRMGRWDYALPDADLFPNDTLRLRQFYNAEVRIDRPRQRGRINFLPELLNQERGLVRRAVSLGRFSDGLYTLREDPAGAGNFGIVIERGALIVDWREGVLPVVAAGTRMPVTGTRLTVMTEPDSGFIYLDEGTVAFPDYPQITVAAGQVYQLRRGLPPTLLVPAAAELQELQRAIRTHGSMTPVRTGFQRLLYLGGHPAVTIGGAALLGGGAYLLVRELTRDDDKGTVVVTIPLF